MNVLIVDDDPALHRALERRLRPLPVAHAYSGREAREQLERNNADLILLDVELPDCSGIELVPDLRDKSPQSRIVVMTGYPRIRDAHRAGALGVHAFHDKSAESYDEVVELANRPVPEAANGNTPGRALASFLQVWLRAEGAAPRRERYKQTRAQLCGALIRATVDHFGGNMRRAATWLDVSYSVVRAKCDERLS